MRYLISFLKNTVVSTFLNAWKAFFALIIFVFCVFISNTHAQLAVTNTMTPTQLVQNVLVGGGVTISNVTYTGGANSKGSFTNGATTNLGLGSGIVLTTGTVTQTANAATYFMNVNLGLAGNAQLNAINNGTSTFDACILEFDFVPLSDTVKFRYVFGSEEYPNWVCSQYQDIFAFFVNGPNPAGGNYTNYNIALIPGTSLPVSVNSVNNGSVGTSVNTGAGGCISLAYSSLYVANSGSTIAFNGFTTPLTAWCKVTPCQTYHMKLAIADGFNGLYDSGVFLEANSFTSTSYSLAETYSNPSLGNNAVESCSNGLFTFSLSSVATTPVTINYTISGSAVNGTDYSLIPHSITITAGQSSGIITISPSNDALSEGTETVILNYMNGCTPQSDTIYIIDKVPVNISMGNNVTTCIGGSVNISVTPNSGTFPYTYSWNNSAGNNSSATVTPTVTTTYIVTVTDLCGSTATGSQIVTISSLTTNAGNDQIICSGNGASLSATNGGTYLWSNSGNTSTIIVTPIITTTYIVTVTSGTCVAVDSVVVNVVQMPSANAGIDNSVCSLVNQLQATASVGIGTWTVTGPGAITFSNVNSSNSNVTASVYGNYVFTWTENNGNGCVSSDNVNYIFAQTPIANAGLDGSSCQLNYPLQAAPSVGIGTWSQLSGPGTSTFVNSHLATTIVTVSIAGNYNFQWVELNSAICSDTDNVAIIFNAQPVANAGIDGQTCSLSFNLVAIPSVGTENWLQVSGPGISSFVSSSSPVTTVTVSVQGSYVYSWTENNNGCTSTDNVSIGFASQPSTNAGIDSTACSLTFVLNAIPSIGVGTWTYTGPGIAAFSDIHNANSSVVVNASGTYVFIWTENNGLGCIASDSVSISFSQPIANAGQNISLCQLNANLSAIPSVGLGTWSQTSGAGTITFANVNDPNTLATASQQGIYVLQWQENNGSSCSSSDNVTAIFTSMPNANAGIDTMLCSQSCTMSAISSIGTGTWSQLSGPGISIFSNVNSASSVLNVTNFGTYTYLWNENNNNGCFDNDTLVIIFNYIPTSDFQFTEINCFNSNATVTYTGTGTSSSNFNWNFGSANIISGSGIGPYVINYTTSGTFPISLQVSQNSCISALSSQNVTNPTEIIVNHSSSNVTCFGYSNGTIATNVTGGAMPFTYLWSNSSVFSSLTNVSEGIYIVTITDNNGCNVIDNVTIYQPAKLVIDINEYYAICSDSSVIIGSSATGGVFPYSYLWNNGLSSDYISVSPDTTTIYTVIATDANGCSSSSNATVLVYPELNLTAFTSIDSICPGEMITISASASGGNGIYSFFLNGEISSLPIVIYPNATQSYQLMVKDGCYSTIKNIPVVVYPSPPNNPLSDRVDGCLPLSVQYNEQSTSSNLTTYYWNFGDGEAAYTQNPLHVFNTAGTFDIALITTNIYGCKTNNVITNWITVYPLPEAMFESTPEYASIIKPIISFDNYSTLAESVIWYFGDGDSSSIYNPTHIYPTSPVGIYDVTLIVFSAYGCTDTIYGNVEIKDEFSFYAPSAFSPDNDGKNELFFVTGNGIDLNSFNIAVFDRWGEVIFESNDILNGWDGKVKNRELAPVGTYTWFAKFRDFKGVAHEKAGPVTLIR
jgi:gliding motility-associated-like protein